MIAKKLWNTFFDLLFISFVSLIVAFVVFGTDNKGDTKNSPYDKEQIYAVKTLALSLSGGEDLQSE